MPRVCVQSGKRGVVQVVRAGPDVEEDQRPEVDDRQPVGVDRPFRPLRHEVVHDRQEARGEEEADRVVAVPPLEHRILHAAPDDHGFGREDRYRHRGVVAEMQHGDRQDEGEIEPVGHEDVGLLAAEDGAEEHQQIGDPDDRQPDVGVPFGLGVFLALGDAEQVARPGDQDEEVVAEDDEPRREVAGEAGPAGALHDVERRREQHVAAEGEDHRRGMQRPQAAEVEPRRDVQIGECELGGDVDADGHAGEAPEQRQDGRDLDRAEVIVRQAVDLERRPGRVPPVVALENGDDAGRGADHAQTHVEGVCRLDRLGRDKETEQRQDREDRDQADFAAPKRLWLRYRLHSSSPTREANSRPLPTAMGSRYGSGNVERNHGLPTGRQMWPPGDATNL